jgi:hypothetical protein
MTDKVPTIEQQLADLMESAEVHLSFVRNPTTTVFNIAPAAAVLIATHEQLVVRVIKKIETMGPRCTRQSLNGCVLPDWQVFIGNVYTAFSDYNVKNLKVLTETEHTAPRCDLESKKVQPLREFLAMIFPSGEFDQEEPVVCDAYSSPPQSPQSNNTVDAKGVPDKPTKCARPETGKENETNGKVTLFVPIAHTNE